MKSRGWAYPYRKLKGLACILWEKKAKNEKK